MQYHTRVRTSTTKQELRLDYLDTLWEKISKPINELGSDGLDEAIEVMDDYYLTKEDLDNIGEMINKEMKLEKTLKQHSLENITQPYILQLFTRQVTH